MTPKIRNIVIFTSIAAALILIYIFFIRQPSAPTATLVSSTSTPTALDTGVAEQNSSVAREFLTLLLSVKSIKLNDAIFADNSFASLRDSSIVLTPDATEGRPNPFAPFGTDIVSTPITTTEEPIPMTEEEESTPPTTPPAVPPVSPAP